MNLDTWARGSREIKIKAKDMQSPAKACRMLSARATEKMSTKRERTLARGSQR